jgi:hypothetical protein
MFALLLSPALVLAFAGSADRQMIVPQQRMRPGSLEPTCSPRPPRSLGAGRAAGSGAAADRCGQDDEGGDHFCRISEAHIFFTIVTTFSGIGM